MPKQRYKCDNAGALCPFALNGKPVEIEIGQPSPCGIPGCKVTDGPPLTSGEGGGASNTKILIACGVAGVVLAGAGGGYYYWSQRPDPAKAQTMIEDYYPSLSAGGKK